MKEKTTCLCHFCKKEFTVFSAELRKEKKKGNNIGQFCSFQCFNNQRLANLKTTTLRCENCNQEFTRLTCHTVGRKTQKSNRFFCSRSCAATYNNKHKTHGTRRSKLESYLEERLRAEFPNLTLICNGKDAIGSELDFYFPQLRLAIELNGIFHYEPIYGTDWLEKVQSRDQQKSLRCAAAGIEFCIIDTSTVNHITSLVKERYWTIVRNLVAPLLGRAGDTGVQVS